MKKQIVEKPRYTDDEVLIINGVKVPTVFHAYQGSPPFHLVRVDRLNLSPILCEPDFNGNARGIPYPLNAKYKDPQHPSTVIEISVGAFKVQSLEPEVQHPHRNHHR